MVGVGQAVSRTLRPRMGGDQGVVAGVDADLLAATTHAQGLTEAAVGSRIKGVVEDHVPIAVQLHTLPDRQIIGGWRQWSQACAFELLEALQRCGFGGAVPALSGAVQR
jgi:hypothetical protein